MKYATLTFCRRSSMIAHSNDPIYDRFSFRKRWPNARFQELSVHRRPFSAIQTYGVTFIRVNIAIGQTGGAYAAAVGSAFASDKCMTHMSTDNGGNIARDEGRQERQLRSPCTQSLDHIGQRSCANNGTETNGRRPRNR
jgi:hypothetical protein